jgi:hypothetical protein
MENDPELKVRLIVIDNMVLAIGAAKEKNGNMPPPPPNHDNGSSTCRACSSTHEDKEDRRRRMHAGADRVFRAKERIEVEVLQESKSRHCAKYEKRLDPTTTNLLSFDVVVVNNSFFHNIP